MKTGTPQMSLNFKACGSIPATHPHKELLDPYTPPPKGANGTGALSLKGAQTSVPGKAEELATLICCGTHSTTSRRAQEPWRAGHLLPEKPPSRAKSPHNTSQAHWAW